VCVRHGDQRNNRPHALRRLPQLCGTRRTVQPFSGLGDLGFFVYPAAHVAVSSRPETVKRKLRTQAPVKSLPFFSPEKYSFALRVVCRPDNVAADKSQGSKGLAVARPAMQHAAFLPGNDYSLIIAEFDPG
jgi:hypothetical protein